MIEPPITDGSGYRVAERDLDFLAITMDQVARWRTGTPLGLSQIQFDALCVELASALQDDGVELESIDIRVKGSSASFFSGHHKAMPRSRSDVIDAFREIRKRFPERWEIDEIMRRLTEEWLTVGPWPQRGPFDALHRVNVAREPSDYDLQISSDEIVRRCEDALTNRGQDASEVRVSPDRAGAALVSRPGRGGPFRSTAGDAVRYGCAANGSPRAPSGDVERSRGVVG